MMCNVWLGILVEVAEVCGDKRLDDVRVSILC